jgi:hypothetical protein
VKAAQGGAEIGFIRPEINECILPIGALMVSDLCVEGSD